MLKKTLFIGLALISVLWVSNVSAQNNKGNKNQNSSQHYAHQAIPGLTDEQAEKIEALRIEHMKIMLDLRNQLAEKQAQFNSLTTGDKIDVAAANVVLEEIAAIKLKMEKARLEHRMAVRKLLTEEQQLWFDQQHLRHSGQRGGEEHGPGNGNGDGMHKGQCGGQGGAQGSGQGMQDGSGPHGSGARHSNPDCPHQTE